MAGGGAREDGRYRGTLGLGVVVPGRDPELWIEAVDLWDHGFTLRGSTRPGAGPGRRLPVAWAVETDGRTPYRWRGGGGGSNDWGWFFDPGLAWPSTELRVFVGPDRDDPSRRFELPAEPSVVIPLAGRAPVRRDVPATLEPVAGIGPGEPPRFDDPLVRAESVIPIGAALTGVGDRDLSVLSITRHPTWFGLQLGGSGGLAGLQPAGDTLRRMHVRWTAEDDRGGRYAGTATHLHSGFPWTVGARLAPALHPAATALQLTFPHPFTPVATRVHTLLPLQPRG